MEVYSTNLHLTIKALWPNRLESALKINQRHQQSRTLILNSVVKQPRCHKQPVNHCAI